MLRKDAEGNIVGCPTCGTRQIKKDGWQYWKTKKRQRWMCNGCGKKFLNPKILEKAQFKTEVREVEHIPIDELIEHRTKQFDQKIKSKKSRKLINVNINTKGPIGILHFGDPHVDDDGTDLAQIYSLCNLVNKT